MEKIESKRTQVEEKFRIQDACLNATANAVTISDRAGRIQWVNPAFTALTGYALEEVIGKTHRVLKSGKHNLAFYQDLWQTISSGKIWHGELINKKKDGNLYPHELTITPVCEEGGKITHFIGISQDITKRKEVERILKEQTRNLEIANLELARKNEELKELHNVKDEFINNVSHELRTPLTIIRESVCQVVDGLFGKINERQHKYLNLSLKNIDWLGNIINDILDISKIENGQFQVFKKNVNIVELIEEVVFDFTPQAKKKGIEIKFSGSKGKIEALADRDKIKQVLVNIIGNAYKFTDKGFIEVSAIENKTNIVCCVMDTGIGIAEKDLPLLFSKFVQIARQPGPGEKGTGLGLAIAKSIVELHDGRILVESTEGKGTKFTFTLPKYTLNAENIRNVLPCLREIAKRYNCYSVLAFGRKDLDEKFNGTLDALEAVIKKKLYRRSDQIVRDKGFVYVILPDADRKDAIMIVDKIRPIIDERNWFGQIKISAVSCPRDGLTEEELMAKLDPDKEEIKNEKNIDRR